MSFQLLMWGDGFYILYCKRNQNLCGKKGKKRGRRKRRKGEEKGERKEREKEAGRERRKRGEREGSEEREKEAGRGGRVEPHLFSSIVSITAIPFTMTLSEGVSEQNMLSNSRCIISSLRGREGGEKRAKIGRERREKEEKGEEMGT